MSGGDIAKVAVPLALTVATGGAAAPLAAGLEGLSMSAELAALAAPALVGAASGAAGSALVGGNPLTGAALGGIGGGIGGYMSGPAEAGALSAGADASGGAAIDASGNVIAPSTGAAIGPDGALASSVSNTPTAVGSLAPSAVSSPATISTATSSGLGSLMSSKYALPIAGGLATLATSGGDGEGQSAPGGNNLKSNNVAPLQREMTATDPNAYYGVGGARSNFVRANPSTVYLAGGGSAGQSKRESDREDANMILPLMGENHPMLSAAAHIVNRYNAEKKYPGSIDQYLRDEYAGTPVAGEMMKAQYAGSGTNKGLSTFIGGDRYAKGGKVQGIGSMVTGAGDGQSDQIPAMLSDGEYVIPAPVVSAIGRGSNQAGAKKLDKMKAHVMKKTYKGSKPPSAGLGIGAMRMA